MAIEKKSETNPVVQLAHKAMTIDFERRRYLEEKQKQIRMALKTLLK